MSLQSPLNKVLGLGSARDGTGHWWAQRVTAVALVPLTIWFAFALVLMPSIDYWAVAAWAAEPLNGILVILLVFTLLYHSNLGLQVVVEDYVHGEFAKVALLMLLRFAHVGLGVAAIYAVVAMSIGAKG